MCDNSARCMIEANVVYGSFPEIQASSTIVAVDPAFYYELFVLPPVGVKRQGLHELYTLVEYSVRTC